MIETLRLASRSQAGRAIEPRVRRHEPRMIVVTGCLGRYAQVPQESKVKACKECVDAAKGEACEEAFTQLDDVDVLVIYADTYENPLRGSLSAEQWDGLFSFVEGGGGLFALHTASACWMDWCNQTECLNSHTNCGANETTKVCP